VKVSACYCLSAWQSNLNPFKLLSDSTFITIGQLVVPQSYNSLAIHDFSI